MASNNRDGQLDGQLVIIGGAEDRSEDCKICESLFAARGVWRPKLLS